MVLGMHTMTAPTQKAVIITCNEMAHNLRVRKNIVRCHGKNMHIVYNHNSINNTVSNIISIKNYNIDTSDDDDYW